MVWQRCSVMQHWLCADLHLSCMSALPPLMTLLGVCVLPVVNAVTRSLKSTARSRAVQIWTIKIGFDPDADSIRIRSIKIGFHPNSVLESVRTLDASHMHHMEFHEVQWTLVHFSHIGSPANGSVGGLLPKQSDYELVFRKWGCKSKK